MIALLNKIYVFDRYDGALKVYRELFENELSLLHVEYFNDFDELLEAEFYNVDLVITSLSPWCDSRRRINRFKKIIKSNNVPVIFSTGCADSNLKKEIAEKFVFDTYWLIKPFTFESLTRQVNQSLINIRRRRIHDMGRFSMSKKIIEENL